MNTTLLLWLAAMVVVLAGIIYRRMGELEAVGNGQIGVTS